ncbi:MAG: 3-phosphoshikimate 1-carboxyvinyltransferase [Verrucomicrobiae bacterium]|nr:3-phosphoshikimate 1-carboxyvinyltransferase [Verrucomicrobiae bacterium]
MPGLPGLLEIEPLRRNGDWQARVTVPGSKSVTNRALILAALGRGWAELRGALWSEDTRVMVEALRRLGYEVRVDPDPAEGANRTIRVLGTGRGPVAGGTGSAPVDLWVGNAGTAARFLTALVCLGEGVFRLRGVDRMHERPQAELFAALRSMGYRIEAGSDRLPAVVHGGGRRAGRCRVSAQASSQFASALLLGARVGGWDVTVEGAAEEELPYVEMTRRMADVFPEAGGVFEVEADASSGSYFWGADAVLGEGTRRAGRVEVERWPTSGWQADAAFPGYLPLPAEISRRTDLADSILTAVVLAPMAERPVRFTELGRLRVQECERVAALRTELGKCGVRVEEEGDMLTVHPAERLHGAEIETYGDHRMAMAFAVLGLRVAGIRLRDPACVGKTFPNFFAKLAAPVPEGLGVGLYEPVTGRRIGAEEALAGDGTA